MCTGFFTNDRQRAAWLGSLGARSEIAYEATVERTLDALAAHLERHIDLDHLANTPRPPRQHDDAVPEPHRLGEVMRHITG